MFFRLLSTIKVKLVDKMMRSTYLCVVLDAEHKKLPILAVFTCIRTSLGLGQISSGLSIV